MTLCFSLLSLSCLKDGPAGPKLIGTVVGFVDLVDVTGTKQANKAGVVVTLTGTGISATSDANGRFELLNVETGTYEVVYTATGWGTYKNPSFSFASGGTGLLSKVTIGQVPTYFPVSLVGVTTAGTRVTVTCALDTTGVTDAREFIVFLGTASTVNGADPTTYVGYKLTQNQPATRTSVDLNWTVAELGELGIVAASLPTLYVIGYGVNDNGVSVYRETTTANRVVFPAISALACPVAVISTP